MGSLQNVKVSYVNRFKYRFRCFPEGRRNKKSKGINLILFVEIDFRSRSLLEKSISSITKVD